MSFIKDLVLAGASGVRIGSEGVTFDQRVIGDFLKDRVRKTFNKPNTTREPRDVRINLEIDAKVDNNVPVVYGTAFVAGQLVDAVLSEDQLTMWYAMSLCEVTGDKINGEASEIQFLEVYRNGNKLQFNSDGTTVIAEFQGDYPNTERNDNINGLMEVYCYSDGSNNPTSLFLQRYPVSHGNAHTLMPGWTPNHSMSKLAFALIKMQFSAENDITELGEITFKLRNTMSEPGDVMVDYMTNTRYGCSIPISEIDV